MTTELSNDPHLHPKVTNNNERNALSLVAGSYVMMEMALGQAVALEREHRAWGKPHFTEQRALSMRHVHESLNAAIREYDAQAAAGERGDINLDPSVGASAADRIRMEAMRHAPTKARNHILHLRKEIDKLHQVSNQHEDVFTVLMETLEGAEAKTYTAEDLLAQQDRLRGKDAAATGKAARR